jgi:retron-type reverse transcriptase
VKRRGYLWEDLTSFANLALAAQKAGRGKGSRTNVAAFRFHVERQLCRLQDELRQKTYTPGGYRTFEIYEPKKRMISAAPFRDRMVHHALCSVLEPIFERTFIFDSYAWRRGKGTHAAVDRFTAYARRYRFVLKCDVLKFFPSVDHEILKSLIARKVRDPEVLWLVNQIIDHSNPQEPVCEWFRGDSLFTPAERRRGLPIGNQTSQFFANVYLDPLDHFVKERLCASAYIRYVDDFVIFSDDKAWLAKAREHCRGALAGLRLRLHPKKCVISRVEDGVRFLGYRVFPTHGRLDRANVTRMERRLRRMQDDYAGGLIGPEAVRRRLAAWIGHAMLADTFRLRRRCLVRQVSSERFLLLETYGRRSFSGGGRSCVARRLVEQQCEELSRGHPQQQPTR